MRENRPIYLKIVVGEWQCASRDKRELRVAEELGFTVIVIATTKEKKNISTDKVDGFKVIRIPTRIYGTGRIRTILSRVRSIRLFVRQIRSIPATIVSGHNYDGWIIGYIAYGKKKKYIYDCHEFELYQKDRNLVRFNIVKCIERFVLRHSDISVMVNDSIADEVKRIYRLENRPIVVRNCPEQSDGYFKKKDENRKEFLNNLNLTEPAFILIYHGVLAKGRGIEESFQAISKLENVGLVLMGYPMSSSYMDYLQEMIAELGCTERVYLKNATEFSNMYDYLAAADVGLVLIQKTCLSFYYSLPNKLMENIQAMTPVIGSDFPEISGVIEKYNIGKTIRPDNVNELIMCIEEMMTGREEYKEFKENLKRAKEDLCWEKERIVLKRAIESLL